MKKICLIITLGALLAVNAAPALALGPVDLGARLDVYNKYVWRGIIANPEAVLQTDLSASLFGFGLGFWGNVDLTDVNDASWKYTEINYKLEYGLSLPLINLGAGLVYYDFPNTQVNSTTEFFISAEANVLLSPHIAYAYDFDEVDGGYFQLGATYASALSPSVGLEVAADLGVGSQGWHQYYFSLGGGTATGTDVTDFIFAIRAPIKPIILLTITPSVAYSTLMSKAKTSYEAAGVDYDSFIFGLSASASF